MPEQLDLEKVAEAYFRTKAPRDRLEYERILLHARSEAIPPILQAMLDRIEAAEPHVKKIIAKHIPIRLYYSLGEKDIRKMWAKLDTRPVLQNACDILLKIEQANQPVSLYLCIGVIEGEYVMKLAAALLLVMLGVLSEDAQEGIQLVIPQINFDYKRQRRKREVLVALLAIVLAHAGETRWKEVIADQARFSKVSIEQWIERITIEGLIELQRKV